jgi:hypothetical protein
MSRKKDHLFPLKNKQKKETDASPESALPSENPAPRSVKKGGKSLRIFFKVCRIVFLWIPASIILLLAVVFIAADLFLSPARVQSLAEKNFNAMSNAKLSLKVKTFSLYSDILIEDIVISNPPGYGDGPFFELKKFHLRYGFFSMLVGRVHFDELGIYKPRAYLLQQKGVWNAAVLMKPTPEKPKKPEVKKVEEPSGPLPSEINLPWPMRFFFNFVLDDVYLYVRGDSFKAELGGVSLRIKIDVPPFKKIPLSLDAISIIKDIDIELNPEEKIDLSFRSDAAGVEPPLVMGWKLIYHKTGNGLSNFESSLRMGTYKTPVRFQNAHLAPLNLLVRYDLFYDPSRDCLTLNDFGISFKDKRWIKLTGAVSDVTKVQKVDIKMAESVIALSDLYPYYVAVTRDESLRFGGTISLLPLTVKGTPANIAIRGGINMRGIQVKMPDIGFELALPLMELSYGLDMNGPSAAISAGISMPHFSYKLARSPSGDNGFFFDAKINARNNFARFDLSSVKIRYFNPRTKEDSLRVNISGDVKTAPALEGTVRIDELYFSKDPLAEMIYSAMKSTITGLPITKPVTGNAVASFNLGGGVTYAKAKLGLRVPDFNVNDLSLNAEIVQNAAKQRIDIKNVSVTSPSFGLNLTVGGFVEMKTAPLSDSDVRVHLALDYPKKKNLYGPWNLNGGIFLDARMKGDLATGKAAGSLAIKHLTVTNPEPQSMLALNDVNMAFPFEYDFAFKPAAGSKIAVDKSGVIDSLLFKEKDNFTVESFSMKHPARDMQFVMMKDLKGSLFFRKNTFEIQKLTMTVLDGTIYGKDILFYLADMNTANMQFNLALDVTNLDVGRLDDPDPKSKKRDAELSLNAKIYGTGLDVSRGMNGISGTIGISKIGEKFANKLMKGLSSEKGKSKLGLVQPVVDNFDIPVGFNYYINSGIMYTTVEVRKKLIGYIIPVWIENDKINFDRIPIQEYLRKVKEN